MLRGRVRRQAAPRLIFGHVPAGYVDGALPVTDEVAGELGAYLDPWAHAP